MTHSLATTGTVASQAPQSMRFPWQDYWSELLILPLGDGLDPGFKSMSPALAGEFFTTEPPWTPLYFQYHCLIFDLPLLGVLHISVPVC